MAKTLIRGSVLVLFCPAPAADEGTVGISSAGFVVNTACDSGESNYFCYHDDSPANSTLNQTSLTDNDSNSQTTPFPGRNALPGALSIPLRRN
jgi:hypothetical protein